MWSDLIPSSQKGTKSNFPFPRWFSPSTYWRPWQPIFFHQEQVCPSYLWGLPQADGWTIHKDRRRDNTILGLWPTIIYSPPFTGFTIEARPLHYPKLICWPLWEHHSLLWKYSATQQPEIPATPTQCKYLHGESGNKTMGIVWAESQKPGSKVLTSEVPVVRMGQTSKNIDMLILPTVATNNQPVPHLKGGADNRKFYLNRLCQGVDVDSDGGGEHDWVGRWLHFTESQKLLRIDVPWLVCTKVFWFCKVSRDKYTFHMKLCVDFFVVILVDKIKYVWLILPVTLTHTHSNLNPWKMLFYQRKDINFSALLK